MASSIDFNKAMMTKNLNPYVYGSAVQQPVQAPEKKPVKRVSAPERVRIEEEEDLREKLKNKKIRRANRINFLYTLGVMCVQYLNIQSSVQGNQAAVTQLQSQLNELTNENQEREVEINTSIDYELIYDTAVNELGMIYPDRDQVITYDSVVSEYVKQYKDIPVR